MILALETATDICSVSFQDREGNIHEKRMKRKGSHSEYVFLFIRELMQEHHFKIEDLEAVVVSNGPGSYTGLRIAASAVKGLLFGLNVDVYAANTLAGFAQGALKLQDKTSATKKPLVIHSVINARRKHLYHQSFRFDGSLTAITTPQILELTAIEEQLQPEEIIVGTGIERLGEKVRNNLIEFGLEAVTATALIELFNHENGKPFFTKTTAEALESNYISSSQVNNTSVGNNR